MKHGKKPSVRQCKIIKSAGLNVENWLVVKDTSTDLVLVHRHSDSTVKTILKGGDVNVLYGRSR